jgi:hypothetical protein
MGGILSSNGDIQLKNSAHTNIPISLQLGVSLMADQHRSSLFNVVTEGHISSTESSTHLFSAVVFSPTQQLYNYTIDISQSSLQ